VKLDGGILLEDLFSKLYEEHYDKLYRLAFRLTGNKDDAEDVIQEVFLNAYKNFHQFSGKSLLTTWLYKIVLNCSYKYIKNKRKLPLVDVLSEFKISENTFFESIRCNTSVEDLALVNDLRETCLQMFINCMPKKQRIAFVLKVLMDLSIEEVAIIMNISSSDVKINVFRARQHMKENMEGRCSLINSKNPCQCKNWVQYAIDNKKEHLIVNINPVSKIDYDEILTSELDAISKIFILYSNTPKHTAYDEFIDKIRRVISSSSFKLLS
jgi:RNA polymerase sigma-70 factor (ECF subfamily)